MRITGSLLPNISWSLERPVGPIPNSSRPRLMWSNSATSAATIAGWWFGNPITPVPKRIWRVWRSSEAMNISGAEICSVVAEKCSPTQASSKPSVSAKMILSASSAQISCSGRVGGCSGIMNSPSFTVWVPRQRG